jgi:hypothetical protein
MTHHLFPLQHQMIKLVKKGVVNLTLTLENMKENNHLQEGLLSKYGGNSIENNMQMLVHDTELLF